MKTRVVLALPLCIALLGGCATTNQSQLVGKRYHQVPLNTFPVQIAKVDGESYLREPVLVDPGPRKIVVQGPPTPTSSGELRSIDLDVKPCTLYYLVAVKPNRLSKDFTVKVDYELPIGACSAAAPMAPPAPAAPEAAAPAVQTAPAAEPAAPDAPAPSASAPA